MKKLACGRIERIGRSEPVAELPEGDYSIANIRDVPETALAGLFEYDPVDDDIWAIFIPIERITVTPA